MQINTTVIELAIGLPTDLLHELVLVYMTLCAIEWHCVDLHWHCVDLYSIVVIVLTCVALCCLAWPCVAGLAWHCVELDRLFSVDLHNTYCADLHGILLTFMALC